MNAPAPSLTAEFEAALEWWRMAGVDHDYAEDATDWLGEAATPVQDTASVQPKPAAATEPELPAPEISRTNLLGDNPPNDLEQFRAFWLETPGLDAIGPRGRVPPRGPSTADLMVLVTDPEQGDGDRLLSGPQGELLSRILVAMGIAEDAVYVASALPRHTPMADTAAIAAGGMDDVVLHHIGIAAPKRLIAFGGNILPLLGHRLPKDPRSLREINQNPSSTPLMMCEGLDSLMAMPRLKARFWRRWMEWSADQ